MYTTNLRKVGGSIMMVVPPALLDMLNLQAGATVAVSVAEGRLVIDPDPGPHYSMAQLLAASDYSRPQPHDERAWVDAPATGRELL